MAFRRNNKVSSNKIRSPRWRGWSSTRKAYAITAAVLAFIFLGAFGMNYVGTGHAYDGCYGTPDPYTTSAYFWTDFWVTQRPNQNSPKIVHLGPGCHTIGERGQQQCNGPAGIVSKAGSTNYWWVYFPARGGWVNEVNAADGGNNQAEWSFSGANGGLFYNWAQEC